MLTAPQWQRVLELYKTAADLPPAAARSLLDSSNEDASILSEVARLLDSPEQQRPREVQPGRHAGLTIGRYRVIAALGRGGFGEVYEGWDRELARPVALKFMIPGYAGAGQAANHFIREARSASALNHPNIVTVHEVITWESSLVIVMELVEGAALRRICGQPLPLPQVIRIGSQILHALEFAHARGFVHRDLKPENVMVRPDGYVKVVDFGLARQFNFDSVASAAGLPAGTWRYTAPEQWRGQSASPASDVFAAGLILHEILTGRHPFHADTPLETAHGIAHRDPDPPSKLVPQTPPALESLIMRMLSKEASDRPPASEAARALAASLETASEGAGKRALLWASIAVAVVLLAAGGFLRWSKDGTGGRAHPVFEAIPFVADAAEADAPRISPSGTQIAYECTYGGSQNICVRDAESGRVERLGKPDTRYEAPTWSPDGNTIAYLRFASPKPDQAEVIVRSPVSGPERVVAVVPETARGGSLKWSPDPRQLIISTTVAPNEALALFLLPIDTGGLKRLTTPLALSSRSSSRQSQYGDRSPAVSKDGKWLAFCRVNAEGLSSLYVVGLDSHLGPTGEPRRLETGQPYNVTPVWTPDGRELVFVSGVYRSRRLMRMWVFEPAQPEPVLPQAGIFGFPEIGRDPRGKQILLFASATSISTLWEQPMRAGQVLSEQLIPTGADDREPSYSPDGKRIVFVTDRSGCDEIWVAERRQTNPVQWTNMRCSQVSFPHWSRDGSRITFSSVCGGQEDIYVVDGPGVKPRRLTDTLQTNENSRWFPDGGWIYFTSVRSGVSSTWKVPEAGGTAAPVNSRLSSDPRISADGHTLYFIRLSDSKLNLMATPADHPGDDQLLVPEVSHYAVGRSGIYFVTAKPGDAAAYFRDSSTGKISVVTRTERWLRGGFDLSADETRLIYARPDVFSVRLMKIDGFQ